MTLPHTAATSHHIHNHHVVPYSVLAFPMYSASIIIITFPSCLFSVEYEGHEGSQQHMRGAVGVAHGGQAIQDNV